MDRATLFFWMLAIPNKTPRGQSSVLMEPASMAKGTFPAAQRLPPLMLGFAAAIVVAPTKIGLVVWFDVRG